MTATVQLDYRTLARELAGPREGRSVALANGCFDLLHVGHVRLVAAARREAEILIVALNTDESVRKAKGSGRPAVPLAERAEVIAALEGVDYVTSFGEPTADALIDALRPEVQIKGTDRDPAAVPERATLEKYGGRIAICGDPKSHSSSALFGKLDEG